MPTIGPYWVGDIPTTSPRIDIDREGQDTDLTVFENVQFTIVGPDGTEVASFFGVVEEDAVSFIWPEDVSYFETPGIYELRMVLTSLVGYRETADPLPFIVQEEGGWHTLASARSEWTNALEDVQLFNLLDIAREQCLAYAPALSTPNIRLRQAQLMQARNLLNAAKSDPAQSNDGDLFVIRPYPLDNFVKQLLRPKRAVPVIA